jgi:hypothetical protein
LRSDILGALAVMLGVGYLVFRESGGGSMSVPSPSRSVPSPSRSVPSPSRSVPSPSRSVPARHPLTLAPSGGASHPFEPALPQWFIKSVETPLPKRFAGKIYMRNIEALRARGL